MYVTGGDINNEPTNLAEVIEVANQAGTPTTLPPMQMPRSCHALAAGGSLVFAFGGIREGNVTSSCELYDSRTNRRVQNANELNRDNTRECKDTKKSIT